MYATGQNNCNLIICTVVLFLELGFLKSHHHQI